MSACTDLVLTTTNVSISVLRVCRMTGIPLSRCCDLFRSFDPFSVNYVRAILSCVGPVHGAEGLFIPTYTKVHLCTTDLP